MKNKKCLKKSVFFDIIKKEFVWRREEKMSDYKKEILSRLKGLVLVVALYYAVSWFIGCPVRFFLGISCPGCGITRAWLAALTLDFPKAFSLHPLFWTVPFLVLAVLFEDRLAASRWRYGSLTVL